VTAEEIKPLLYVWLGRVCVIAVASWQSDSKRCVSKGYGDRPEAHQIHS